MNGNCGNKDVDTFIERSNPKGVFDPGNKFSQVVRVRDADLLFISGQVAFDEKGDLIGPNNIRQQLVKVFDNIKLILSNYNADFKNVIRFTIYIVDYQSDDRFVLHEVQSQYVDTEHPPASTLLGVQSLARPDIKVEIDAIVALP